MTKQDKTQLVSGVIQGALIWLTLFTIYHLFIA